MKVLLIFPNMGVVTGEPPMGIGYLAASLREDGIKVKVLDTTFNSSFSYIEKRLKKEKADIVGIYASTVMLKDSIKTAKIAKSIGTEFVVMGGPHATILSEETLINEDVDAVVVGEGEYSFQKIVQRFERNNDIKDLIGIPNVSVKIDGKIKKHKKRHFVKNLDSLPFPARDFFDMKNYIKHWFQLDAVSPNLRGTNVCLSRSCPFSCTFCQPTLKEIFGPRLRRRGVQNIVEELKSLRETYRINAVQSVDDMFFIGEKYIQSFCKEMIKEHMDIVWGCQSRVDTVPNNKTLKMSYKAGLRMISLGIESGSQRILNLYNKQTNLAQIKTAVEKLRKNNIRTRGYFILGAPTETIKDIKQTIKFAAGLNLDEAAFSILTPFPGTHIYKIAKSRGWEISEDWGYKHYYSRGGFITGALSERTIKLYQRLAFLTFYLHPYRAKYLANSMLNLKRTFTKLKCYFV